MAVSRVSTAVLSSLVVIAAGAGAFAVTARQEMPVPTEQHAEILKGVGDWEGTLTYFMMNPAGDAVRATQRVDAIGGFWTQTRFECDFMGMPYVGTGCVGYDPEKEKYVGTWIDNMSSYLAVMEGEKDEQTGAIVMRWKAPDPMSGSLVPHRNEIVETDDRSVSTFYAGEGEGEKIMVIDLKRKGAKPAGAEEKKGG